MKREVRGEGFWYRLHSNGDKQRPLQQIRMFCCFSDNSEADDAPRRRKRLKQVRRNEKGETDLHKACIEGQLKRVELLLEQVESGRASASAFETLFSILRHFGKMFVLIAEFFSPDHPLFKAKWSVIAAIFVTKANFIFV